MRTVVVFTKRGGEGPVMGAEAVTYRIERVDPPAVLDRVHLALGGRPERAWDVVPGLCVSYTRGDVLVHVWADGVPVDEGNIRGMGIVPESEWPGSWS